MAAGKRRTREHVIADLSVNYVEGQVLRAGFTVERVASDYGMDLLLATYNSLGEIEPGYVYMQLKATDRLTRLKNGGVTCTVDVRDLRLWLREFHPVILIVYDVSHNRAYWLDVQAYFASTWRDSGTRLSAFRTLRFPRRCRLKTESMVHFANLKRKMYENLRGR